MSLGQKTLQTLAVGVTAMALLLAGCGGGGTSMPSSGPSPALSGLEAFQILQAKDEASKALNSAKQAWDDAVEAARVARAAADGAAASKTNEANAMTAAEAAERAASEAEMAYNAALTAYNGIDESGTVEAAQTALDMVKSERDKALTHSDTAIMERNNAQAAAAQSSYHLFVHANGQDIGQPSDDMTVEQLRAAETTKFATQMAQAFNGKPENPNNNNPMHADVTISWPAEEDDGEEGLIRIAIDIDDIDHPLRIGSSDHFSTQDVDSNPDLEIDYVEPNSLPIEGLGEFMHGFQIYSGDDVVDNYHAVVFTDKQQGEPGQPLIVETPSASHFNVPLTSGVYTIPSTAEISSEGGVITITGGTFYDNELDREEGEHRGYSVDSSFVCSDSTQCEVTIDDGVISLIGPFRFTGAREAVPGQPAIEPKENNDYLVFGLWLYEDSAGENENFGAFADSGRDLPRVEENAHGFAFNQISGTATYSGKAFGAHHREGVISWFDADANLDMDFGISQNFPDTLVKGVISNINVAGELFPDSIHLTKPYGGSNRRDVIDQAVMGPLTDDLINLKWEYTGSWTLDTYGTANSKPKALTGTFQLENSDKSETFLGAFGARMDEE